MSSKGEAGGAILGAVIGSFSGQWWLGLQLGAAIGGMLAPPQAPNAEQGRLSDLRGSGSSQGVPIPTVYGRNRVGCTVIYLGDVREVKPSSSGGGGKK